MSTSCEVGENAPPVCLLTENPHGLVSLWDMLQDFLPFYEIARELGVQRQRANLNALYGSNSKIDSEDATKFKDLLSRIERQCKEFGLARAARLASKALSRGLPERSAELIREIDHFNDVLTGELEAESLFRIPSNRKDYFECNDLFGPSVEIAFPSCGKDIRKAGSCYALEQEDACVHHLMLVLERGLLALAVKVGGSSQPSNWQQIINDVTSQLNKLPRGPERDFYLEVNAQFGFLKHGYRNHYEHAHDDPYDLDKALSIFNHVRDFMQALTREGLKE